MRRGDVDDVRFHVVILARMLHAVGSRRAHRDPPRQAVAYCREDRADLVPLGLHIPDHDGYAVLYQLRDTASEDELLPALVLTAETTVPSRDRALQAGAKDFRTRPLDYTEVVLCVRNLLGTRALHLPLQQPNAVLPAELDARSAAERQLAKAAEGTRRADRRRARAGPAADAVPNHPGPARSHHRGVRGAGPARL